MSIALAPAADATSPIAAWVTAEDIGAITGVSTDELNQAGQAASELLWALSGRQFPGEREATVRLLAPACSCSGLPLATGRRLDSEAARWAETYGTCGCSVTVMLPDPDVTEIVTVTVDGTVLLDSQYELEDGQRLVRTDGHGWPLGSDGDRDRLVVTYLHGQPPPAGGVRAAKALATAWAKAGVGGKCGIPSRSTQISAEGVTVVFDDFEVFRKGGTGIAEADQWLFSVNPKQLTRRASVLSPDSVRAYRT